MAQHMSLRLHTLFRPKPSIYRSIHFFLNQEQFKGLNEFQAASDVIKKNNFPASIENARRLHNICEHSMGSTNEITFNVFKGVLWLLCESGKYRELEKQAKKHLSQGDINFEQTLDLQMFLAKSCLYQGDYESAAKISKYAIEFGETQQQNDTDVFLLHKPFSIHGISNLLLELRNEAEDSLQQACRVAPDGPLAALSLNNLGVAQYWLADEAKRFEEAIGYWTEALTNISQKPEDETKSDDSIDFHTSMAILNCNIGEVKLQQGELQSASEIFSTALKHSKCLSEPRHPVLIRNLSLFAKCYHKSGQAVTSEGLYRSAIDMTGSVNSACPTWKWERAAVLENAGELMRDWEKRELEGDSYQAEANQLRTELLEQIKQNGKVNPRLDSMLHLFL